MFQGAFTDLHLPLRLIARADLVLIMIAIGLLIAPSMHHRIVERGEDSDHSHFAVIEMSLESWKLEADEADILRHRWREEASTWVNVGAYVD